MGSNRKDHSPFSICARFPVLILQPQSITRDLQCAIGVPKTFNKTRYNVILLLYFKSYRRTNPALHRLSFEPGRGKLPLHYCPERLII